VSNWPKIKAWFTTPRIIALVLLLAAVLFLYWFRATGLIHGLVIFFYTWPLLWFLPLSALVLVTLLRLAIKHWPGPKPRGDNPRRRRDDFYSYRRQSPVAGATWAAWGLASLGLLVALIIQSPLNSQATYNYYQFTTSENFPQLSAARILPYQVAERMSSSGFDSSTERLDSEHIYVDQQGQLQWSFAQIPSGFFRYWSKKTAGLAQQPAEQTAREMSFVDREFKYSPQIGLTDNIHWKLYKRDYFSKIAATVFMLDERQEPVIVAPFIKYRGFLTKVPYLGGVYVLNAQGEIKEYSPQQAAKIPYLAQSGQIFPAKLARQVQESYKYRGGIWNRFFIHEDQVEIADTEDNAQPYLMTFTGRRPQWVSTAEPYGRSYATKAVFLTDSVSGKTELWEPQEGQSLSGNKRVLEVVRGLAIPGILFNKFKAIEPRPVLVDERLKFIVSVVPDSFNTVTKTVIVDAANNKAEKIFDHDQDPQADRQLRQYLRGATERGATIAAADVSQPGEQSGDKNKQQEVDILEQLLRENEAQREAINQLLQQARQRQK